MMKRAASQHDPTAENEYPYGETAHGSLKPFLSAAIRSVHPRTWTLRVATGFSPAGGVKLLRGPRPMARVDTSLAPGTLNEGALKARCMRRPLVRAGAMGGGGGGGEEEEEDGWSPSPAKYVQHALGKTTVPSDPRSISADRHRNHRRSLRPSRRRVTFQRQAYDTTTYDTHQNQISIFTTAQDHGLSRCASMAARLPSPSA